MDRLHPNRLLVEGAEDLRVIPFLMECFIPWEDDNRPVHIEEFGGVENLLKPGIIETKMKTRGLRALGVLIDANDNPAAR